MGLKRGNVESCQEQKPAVDVKSADGETTFQSFGKEILGKDIYRFGYKWNGPWSHDRSNA